MANILELLEISKTVGDFVIIDKISLQIKKGEVVALVGLSGSGKSTILQISGLLDQTTSGEVYIRGENCTKISDQKRTTIRRNYLGFVYQQHYLLQEFSVLENIMLPQIILGFSKATARKNSLEMLGEMDLSDKSSAIVSQLSGGERQRVAIARALINHPALFLADEPTGNLDPVTSERIFSLLCDYAKVMKMAMFIVTHNIELAKKADRVIYLHHGKINKTVTDS